MGGEPLPVDEAGGLVGGVMVPAGVSTAELGGMEVVPLGLGYEGLFCAKTQEISSIGLGEKMETKRAYQSWQMTDEMVVTGTLMVQGQFVMVRVVPVSCGNSGLAIGVSGSDGGVSRQRDWGWNRRRFRKW